MVSCGQIDEGIMLNVAGGLMLEHPLTLPFVEAVVCLPPLSDCTCNDLSFKQCYMYTLLSTSLFNNISSYTNNMITYYLRTQLYT